MAGPKTDASPPRWLIALGTAAILLALALADGGFPPAVFGAATASVWLVIAIGVTSGALRPTRLSRSALAAVAALAGLAAITALSIEWAGDRGAALEDLVLALGYLGAFGAVALVARPGQGPAWLGAIALAAAGVAALALASRLAGLGGADRELAGLLPNAAGRLSYPLGYWNALGTLIAAGAPALLWLALEGGSRRLREAALAALPALALVVFLTASRGAVLAAGLGIGIVIWLAADRWRALVLALAAGAASMLPIAAATQSRVLEGHGEAFGLPEAAVAAALGMACAALVLGRRRIEVLAERLEVPGPLLGVRPRVAIGVASVAVAGALALGGPSLLLGEFREPTAGPASAPGEIGPALVSGSGRAQFWEAAIDALRDEPLRGVGAGGYGSWWNATGSLDVTARNAHSAPLEAFAELGLIGGGLLLAWVGMVLTAGVRAARGPGGARSPAAGAALGVLAAGLLGASIDWIWQMPAAFLPAVICAALLCAGAFPAPGAAPSGPRRPAPDWIGGLPARAAVVGVAIAAAWVAGVIGLTGARLDASADALERGELAEAARNARGAASISPWAAEPRLRLVSIEQSAGNLEAARRAAREAIERAPDDYRGWLALSEVEIQLDQEGPGELYAARALELAPLVLPRALRDRADPIAPR